MHYSFDTAEQHVLVMEFAGPRDLFSAIHVGGRGRLPEAQARLVVAELVVALEQLHMTKSA